MGYKGMCRCEGSTSFPGFSSTRSMGRVGENPGNEVGEGYGFQAVYSGIGYINQRV